MAKHKADEQAVLELEPEPEAQADEEVVEPTPAAWSVTASGFTEDDNADAILQADVEELFTRHAEQGRVDEFTYTSEAVNVEDLSIDDIVPPDNVIDLVGTADDAPPDGGGEGDPGPAITDTNPVSLVAGVAVDLKCNGSGFVDGSEIEIDGPAVATTFVSPTRVTAEGYVPPAPPSIAVSVRNPDSSESNTVTVTVE